MRVNTEHFTGLEETTDVGSNQNINSENTNETSSARVHVSQHALLLEALSRTLQFVLQFQKQLVHKHLGF